MGNSTGSIRKQYAIHHTLGMLEINKLRTINEKDKTFTVLNRDHGAKITTFSWKALFMKMGNH